MFFGFLIGWHHWLNRHKFKQGPGVGDGQESLACCSPWGRKELDTTEQLNWITSYPLGWLLFKSKHKTMENNKYQILARMWKNWNFCALLVGIYNDATTVENTLRVPHKIKDRFAIWSSNSHSYMYTRKNWKKARIQTDTCTPVFIVALFTKTRRWAQSKCSSTDKWVNKMWWMLAMTYYSAMERNEIVTIFYNMGEAWRHYAKWNKPGTRGQIWNTVYLHLSQVPKRVKSMEKEHRGYQVLKGEWNGRYYLMSIKFWFYKMEKFMKTDGDYGCTTLWMCLISLNCPLKNG